MKDYTVFDAQTGEPKRWGKASDITVQAAANEIVRQGYWPEETHILRGGRPASRNTRRRADMVLARLWRDMRIERNRLLIRYVDRISAVQWSLMNEAERNSIRAYRQALLDIPQTQNDPRAITWPAPPDQQETGDA
ncbi:MAG: phage tail assembly chaperone [Pseudomonadota bacterium]